jgi:hypothetical protein
MVSLTGREAQISNRHEHLALWSRPSSERADVCIYACGSPPESISLLLNVHYGDSVGHEHGDFPA